MDFQRKEVYAYRRAFLIDELSRTHSRHD
ncbi:MAG: hypothetical protein R3C02_15390 [Planctomycetaceae bacterium]